MHSRDLDSTPVKMEKEREESPEGRAHEMRYREQLEAAGQR